MISLRSFALPLAALVLAGCGTTVEFTRLRSAPPAKTPRTAAQIEVFMAKQPERRFIEIGILEASGQSVYSTDDTSDMIAAMRAEAAEHGCDAIIVVGPNDKVVGAGWGKPGGFVGTIKGFRASCVAYPEDR